MDDSGQNILEIEKWHAEYASQLRLLAQNNLADTSFIFIGGPADYNNATRDSLWDLGAFEYASLEYDTLTPGAPSGLVVL